MIAGEIGPAERRDGTGPPKRVHGVCHSLRLAAELEQDATAAVDACMSPEQIIATVWRRKLAFLLTLLVCVGATVAATLSLPEKYSATATMFVGERSEGSEALLFDTNAGEQLARTYTALASNPNVANLVRQRLDGRQTSEQLLDKVSFAPVERTQLL